MSMTIMNINVKGMKSWTEIELKLIDKLKKKKADCMDSHKIIRCNHPSPLSANRGGWFNTKPFSKCNEYLTQVGSETIDWVGS